MCSITSRVTLASRLSGWAALGVLYLPLFTVFEILAISVSPHLQSCRLWKATLNSDAIIRRRRLAADLEENRPRKRRKTGDLPGDEYADDDTPVCLLACVQ